LESSEVLLAMGGPIQAVRETTQALYNGPVKALVLLGANAAIAFAFRTALDAVQVGIARGADSPGTLAQELAKLFLFCLAIDVFGDASYLIPGGLGEAADLVWAPGSALLLRSIFDSDLVAALQLFKEIVPGTDVLPVASIAFLLANVFPETALAKALGLDGGSDDSQADGKGGDDRFKGGH